MQDNRPKGWRAWPAVGCVALFVGVACAPRGEGPPPVAAPGSPASTDGADGSTTGSATGPTARGVGPGVAPAPAAQVSTDDSAPKQLAPPTSPADIARAKRLLAKGTALYRRGEYESAEDALKEAMTLYPFLAETNLLLGKIFLIRGAASLDPTLIDHARLMFEMARKLDPNLRETALLLELFAPPPSP